MTSTFFHSLISTAFPFFLIAAKLVCAVSEVFLAFVLVAGLLWLLIEFVRSFIVGVLYYFRLEPLLTVIGLIALIFMSSSFVLMFNGISPFELLHLAPVI